jgi:hypothetical protein
MGMRTEVETETETEIAVGKGRGRDRADGGEVFNSTCWEGQIYILLGSR